MKATAKTTKSVVTLKEVTLTLSAEEAKTIGLLLFHTGGSPTTSRRKLTEIMLKELRKVLPVEMDKQLDYPASDRYFQEGSRAIYFADEKGLL